MTNTISNSGSITATTIADINASKAQARSAYTMSKDGAAKAVGHIYIVWQAVQSPHAPQHLRSAFAAEIDKINNGIQTHNSDEAKLKKRVTAFKAGTLDKKDTQNSEVVTEEDKALVAADLAKLIAVKDLTEVEWKQRRLVPILPSNQNQFLQVVKYVLDFKRRADASSASRYAKACEWVHNHFGGHQVNSNTDVFDAIKAHGGFEDVVDAMRGGDDETETNDTSKEVIINQTKAIVGAAPPKASITYQARNGFDGYVTLIGRYADGIVDIVGELPLDETSLNEALYDFDDESLMPTHPNSEFLSRVLAFSPLVKQGEATSNKQDGNKAGSPQASERALSLVPDNSGVKMVLSGRYVAASVVVYGVPAISMVTLGTVTTPVMLSGDPLTELTKAIDKRQKRRLVDVNATVAGSDVAFAVTGFDTPVDFTDMALTDEKPLCIAGFKPQFSVVVGVAALKSLYEKGLHEWSASKGSNKNQKKMFLHFSGSAMSFSIDGKTDIVIAVKGHAKGITKLRVSPRNFHDIVNLLLASGVNDFTIEGDTGGLLAVSWADKYGSYMVAMPLLSADGVLLNRRIEPMVLESDDVTLNVA